MDVWQTRRTEGSLNYTIQVISFAILNKIKSIVFDGLAIIYSSGFASLIWELMRELGGYCKSKFHHISKHAYFEQHLHKNDRLINSDAILIFLKTTIFIFTHRTLSKCNSMIIDIECHKNIDKDKHCEILSGHPKKNV